MTIYYYSIDIQNIDPIRIKKFGKYEKFVKAIICGYSDCSKVVEHYNKYFKGREEYSDLKLVIRCYTKYRSLFNGKLIRKGSKKKLVKKLGGGK